MHISCLWIAPIAQLVEHPTLNRLVAGSNPAGRTKRKRASKVTKQTAGRLEVPT